MGGGHCEVMWGGQGVVWCWGQEKWRFLPGVSIDRQEGTQRHTIIRAVRGEGHANYRGPPASVGGSRRLGSDHLGRLRPDWLYLRPIYHCTQSYS